MPGDPVGTPGVRAGMPGDPVGTLGVRAGTTGATPTVHLPGVMVSYTIRQPTIRTTVLVRQVLLNPLMILSVA
jgi:hypothetical protein